MPPAVRTALLAAAAVGALCAASSASAQSYGRPYGYDRYAPPPPPPPPEGRYYPRDDRYTDGFDSSIPGGANSDGSLGLRNYASRPDTTPDDPGRVAYDAEKDRRVEEARGYRDSYAPPPPSRPYAYAPDYSARYGDGYGRPDERRYAEPRGPGRYDDDYAPPPRYRAPDTVYAPYPPPRGW